MLCIICTKQQFKKMGNHGNFYCLRLPHPAGLDCSSSLPHPPYNLETVNLTPSRETQSETEQIALDAATGNRPIAVLTMDGYFLSYLLETLTISPIYYWTFYNNFAQKLMQHHRKRCAHYSTQSPLPSLSLLINMTPPIRHFLDPIGNEIASSMLQEKVNIDCALSWLSTLGGAFSSLGEISKTWATSAGETSLKQLKLAIRLKDPLVTSRCKIYLSLSLIQRGHLRLARKILENEYKFFLSLPTGMDNRLGKMCQGVWHKLKYEWDNKRTGNKKLLLQQERNKIESHSGTGEEANYT